MASSLGETRKDVLTLTDRSGPVGSHGSHQKEILEATVVVVVLVVDDLYWLLMIVIYIYHDNYWWLLLLMMMMMMMMMLLLLMIMMIIMFRRIIHDYPYPCLKKHIRHGNCHNLRYPRFETNPDLFRASSFRLHPILPSTLRFLLLPLTLQKT